MMLLKGYLKSTKLSVMEVSTDTKARLGGEDEAVTAVLAQAWLDMNLIEVSFRQLKEEDRKIAAMQFQMAVHKAISAEDIDFLRDTAQMAASYVDATRGWAPRRTTD